MGVHLTFVRSVDLDEWTQRQIDAMKLGGNGNARSYFRKHGFTDLYGGKAEKKYTSKAAVSYKAELAKLMDAEAIKRGEMAVPAANDNEAVASNLLANLDLADQKTADAEARAKLAAARAAAGNPTGTSAGVLTSKAKLASAMPGASKLSVPAGGMLRKPTGGLKVGSKLLKKPTVSSNKLRINKLSMKLPTNTGSGSSGDMGDFEDVETTQKSIAEAEAKAKQAAKDAADKKKQEEEEAKKKKEEEGKAAALKAANGGSTATGAGLASQAQPKPTGPPKSTMEGNMAKLKAMNSDFFTDF